MIKHLLSIILLSAIIGSASAQVSKGSFYLGGSFNYNYDQAGTTNTYSYTTGTTYYTNNHITDFQVSPDFGYFFADNWAVGLQLGYTRTSGQEINDYVADDNTTTSYIHTDSYHTDAVGIGVHFRYYWMLNDKVGIFPQFGVTTANDLQEFSAGTLSIGGNPNIVFFATPSLAINLGFGNLQYNMDYKTKDVTFNAGLNTNISFGLNYYWGK
jgi:hypothetical protein